MRAYRSEHGDEIRHRNKRYREEHPEQVHDYQRAYRETHDEKLRDQKKNYHQERVKMARTELFQVYKPKCSCCGEADERFLTLHHTNGGATKQRRARGAVSVIMEAVKANDPTVYKILCFNCHLGMHSNHGVCPHKMNGNYADAKP